MKKILLAALVLVASFGLGFVMFGDTQEKVVAPDLPNHQFVQLPSEGRLMNIECGQPCAVIFSAEVNAYIALLLDGDTITFTLPEPEPEPESE